ncbi:MAG: CRISPR-associated protein Cas4 [Bryobacteraceae bacterium]
MFSEDDLIPISALQHFVFCERQWALIHLEQIWEENRLTAEGRAMHEKVDTQPGETRPGIRIARGLLLRSLSIGLIGRADVVEFSDGGRRVVPVEYKRGRPKPDWCDEAQLCAQALCLEEMLGVDIERGAIFYGQPRRRHEVAFDAELRQATIALAGRIRAARDSGVTPPAVYERKCQQCSLIERCMPKAMGQPTRAEGWLSRMLESS